MISTLCEHFWRATFHINQSYSSGNRQLYCKIIAGSVAYDSASLAHLCSMTVTLITAHRKQQRTHFKQWHTHTRINIALFEASFAMIYCLNFFLFFISHVTECLCVLDNCFSSLLADLFVGWNCKVTPSNQTIRNVVHDAKNSELSLSERQIYFCCQV